MDAPHTCGTTTHLKVSSGTTVPSVVGSAPIVRVTSWKRGRMQCGLAPAAPDHRGEYTQQWGNFRVAALRCNADALEKTEKRTLACVSLAGTAVAESDTVARSREAGERAASSRDESEVIVYDATRALVWNRSVLDSSKELL